MKKMFIAIVSILLLGSIFSCQKDNDILSDIKVEKVIDTLAIQSQLFAVQTPTDEKVKSAISNLKSAEIEDKSLAVWVLPLDSSTYYVYTNDNGDIKAVKLLAYYEMLFGYRSQYLTINQEFDVDDDGKIDPSSSVISTYQVACPYSNYYFLRDGNNVVGINYYFRFDDKKKSQFSYFGDSYNGSIKLPPLAGGHWQLEVIYNDGDYKKNYLTKFVDYYGSNIIDLNFQLKDQNAVATVKVNSILTKGYNRINLVGIDPETGEELYANYPVAYDESQNRTIMFDAPFDILYVFICGDNGCRYYQTEVIGINGNKTIYKLVQ